MKLKNNKQKNNIIILSEGAGTFISFFLLLLLVMNHGGSNNIAYAEPTPLKIIVFIDSLANDKGKVTVRDQGSDFQEIKPYETDAKGFATVTFSVPPGKIGIHEEFTAVVKSDVKDLIDSDKGINRPLNAPEHLAVNTLFGKD